MENSKHKNAKILYGKIGKVWCPVLNDFISFDNTGFRHLIRKGKELRSRSEQERRFDLLRYAEDILSNPEVSFSHELMQNKEPPADFWAFTQVVNGVRVKIVIKQVEHGKKHFLSIYGKEAKKQKPAL